ncbi:MAG TPA: glycosyl transferase [Cyanobacteria bacterium UBA8803]|nr:glycosyl transferase [Cyanobacteria bacterium UBA9273]HBL60864.1 glycosyl transferase [Cyanobacteria bacterium UBA8803]
MVKPLVSIIINNYNYDKFLRESIDSALSQTYSDTEVIVVDDGSADNSQEIITSYGNRIVPVLKSNGGQASALNAGFAASRGEIVIFLDADDYLFPKAVEQVVAIWQPGLANIQYRLELIDAQGKLLDIYPAREVPFDTGEVWPILLEKGRYSAMVTSGNAFSREALTQVLPIPEADFRISADGYLITVIPFYGQILAIEEPLGAYRKHGSNLWALSGQELPVASFRKSIKHDFDKYKVLLNKAQELGHTVNHELGFHDHPHLISRIASLRLDPENHPVSFDSPLGLAIKGYWAIWKYSEYPWKRKIILSTWFLWVGLMPKPLVKPAITWLVASQSRPKAIDWLLKKIRSLSS